MYVFNTLHPPGICMHMILPLMNPYGVLFLQWFFFETEEEAMWEIVAKDFDTLIKIAVSIEGPELHVSFIVMIELCGYMKWGQMNVLSGFLEWWDGLLSCVLIFHSYISLPKNVE